MMGMLDKFWNTNARPKGWIGRMALRMMNLSHTPIALWNLSLIDFQPDWTILDVGCGGGKNIARMLKRCPKGTVYGVDYSEESVAMSRKKNRKLLGSRCFIEQADVRKLPFDDSKFDLVTAYETVYFWPDLEKAFSEVYRVLNPGGLFTFSYGLESSASMRYWASKIDTMTLRPVVEITKILEKVGFTNLKTSVKGDYTVNITVTR